MKTHSLFDRIYGEKRIVVTKDRHNWIVKFGSPKQKEEIFEKKAEYWYFSTLEAMLVHLHDFMLKAGLGSLDIEEITSTTPLFIYPNPFTNATTVVFENEEQAPYKLVLYDVLGNQVRVMENITTNEITIEKGHLTPGVYFISLQRNGKALRGKLMVESPISSAFGNAPR